MGMIRVSDNVEKRLKEVADGRSMNAVIEKMLAYCSSPGGFCPTPQDTGSYEPYLLEHINKRFDELKALIEDTTVDRLASNQSYQDPVVRKALARVDVDWPIVQSLIYDFLDEKAPEWFPGAYQEVHNMDVEVVCYIKDGVLYFEVPATCAHWPVLHISPRIDAFLADRITGGLHNVA